MNTIRGIYPVIISKENLYQSAYLAAKARRYTDSVAEFNFHLEEEIEKLHKELQGKTYKHGEYRVFMVYDPKERRISAAPFRDRVVHHAVHDVIEPLMDKSFIYHSYACRKNKGTHKAINWAQEFLRLNAFCLHGDIKKYFYSIDHDILKGIIRRKIEDDDLLWLLDEIVNSAVSLSFPVCHCEADEVSRSNPKVEIASVASLSRNDTSVACPRNDTSVDCPRNDTRRGLPIGNLTSQFFANLYLNELDYFVKFVLKAKFYIRYMDDFIIFENDRGKLVMFKAEIREFLRIKLVLELHEGKSQIYNTKNGIKFLGFRIFKNHRKLATDNVRRFKKRLKEFGYLLDCGRIKENQIRDSARCWAAHSSYANTNGLRLNMFNALIKKDEHLGNLLKDVLLPRGGGIMTSSLRGGRRPTRQSKPRLLRALGALAMTENVTYALFVQRRER